MKQQVIITKTIVGWYNIKDTKHNLLLNVSPQVFEQYFPEINNNDVQIAVLEMDLSRITEIKNKKKVGS
ncbi:pathogenicity island protein [Staphylococcus pseudintermedius]